MGADRRGFIGSLLAAGAIVRTGGSVPADTPAPSAAGNQPWLDRIHGKHRTVFDNPRDDSTGIIRAWIWLKQCASALDAKDKDCSAVVVLRHGGLTLGMNDAFWEKYELSMSGGTPDKPNVPKRNPAMAAVMKDSMGSYPPPARPWAEGVGLDALIDRGGIVVGCEFAFWGLISRVMQRDKLDEKAAREVAVSYLVPGVTLVPSGFFALAAAQGQGCGFITNV